MARKSRMFRKRDVRRKKRGEHPQTAASRPARPAWLSEDEIIFLTQQLIEEKQELLGIRHTVNQNAD